MHDPMALATDYLLGFAAIVFAIRLRRVHPTWALAFAFTALAAILGGTYHAFAPSSSILWKCVVFSVGIGSFFLLAGSGGRALRGFALVKLVVFLIWMASHDAFAWVIADYGVTLVIVGIVHAVWRSAATPWVLSSIAASIVGALVQQSDWSLHPYWMDANDLYHLIQTVALWMLYRGGHAAARPAGQE